ncbi:MAG: hypothetical protein QG673_1567 [Pseudomonadota bacterium]|nr:hypothetical protein [Pseudomonadota bacterium]
MYYFVERSVAVIKPKYPLLEWVNQSFTDLPQELTLDSIRIDCNSYLIPEVEEIEDGIKFIDDKFADIFALELASWTEDESMWPTNLSLKMFWEWFDVEVQPTIIDLTSDYDDNDEQKVEETLH